MFLPIFDSTLGSADYDDTKQRIFYHQLNNLEADMKKLSTIVLMALVCLLLTAPQSLAKHLYETMDLFKGEKEALSLEVPCTENVEDLKNGILKSISLIKNKNAKEFAEGLLNYKLWKYSQGQYLYVDIGWHMINLSMIGAKEIGKIKINLDFILISILVELNKEQENFSFFANKYHEINKFFKR